MSRTITPAALADLDADATLILDVRRARDYADSDHMVAGASWKDPAGIDSWIGTLADAGQVIIYCARGGGVSNSVVDRLQAEGIDARFIEGGIAAVPADGGMLVAK